MRRGEGEVLKERLVAMILRVFLQVFNGMVSHLAGQVIVVAKLEWLFWLSVRSGDGFKVTADGQRRLFKSGVCRLAIDVPFPRVIRSIPDLGQHFRQQHRPRRALALVSSTAWQARQKVSSNLLGVKARHHCASGRPASPGVVELCEPQPALSQRIKIGGLDFSAIATQIREP